MVDYEKVKKDLGSMDEKLRRTFYIIVENINNNGIEFYREHIITYNSMSSLTILPLTITFHYDNELNIIIDKIIIIIRYTH